jgi:GNAT superfamily N-acetyltransferase
LSPADPQNTTRSGSPPRFQVRVACHRDLEVIAEFNQSLALETEGKSLDPTVLVRGVQAALDDPLRLAYWVAETESGPTSDAARVIGQAAVTREWSDWRYGWLWWFQSVYVRPEARGHGVFRALHAAIRAAALAKGDVVGLRLYVENANTRAQATYQAVGMSPGGYHVYEEIWPDRFGRGSDTSE